jgi:hypothetical protein
MRVKYRQAMVRHRWEWRSRRSMRRRRRRKKKEKCLAHFQHWLDNLKYQYILGTRTRCPPSCSRRDTNTGTVKRVAVVRTFGPKYRKFQKKLFSQISQLPSQLPTFFRNTVQFVSKRPVPRQQDVIMQLAV